MDGGCSCQTTVGLLQILFNISWDIYQYYLPSNCNINNDWDNSMHDCKFYAADFQLLQIKNSLFCKYDRYIFIMKYIIYLTYNRPWYFFKL